jgi:hypothetical protein
MKEKVESTVYKAFAVESTCQAEFLKGVDTSLLKDPCANPGKHMVGSVALENQVADSRAVEQRAQDQPGGTRANDRNLNTERRTHHSTCCVERSGLLA